MSELAVKVENVSKEYRLGVIGGATIKGEIQSKIAKLLKKEDPNLKIGEKAHGKNVRFLAVDDLSFEVKKGETIGIIGRNGAGKSTILKLICRVTTPTKGNIYLNGRITSMLEVGTGFHPELTGRENVYLNGAILGMSKSEIDKKFDEIVEFSEVGQFIDTPIKRYSSGMKVKLAFAVASHLDSEIMIMDEVLAVGDVNFQNKCIDRMKKVAETEGKTILYVNHNMTSVKKLCDRCIVLSHGQKIFDGDTDKAIAIYMEDKESDQTFFDTSKYLRDHKSNNKILIQSLELLNVDNNHFSYGDKFKFRMNWISELESAQFKLKMVVAGTDMEAVGVAYGGVLNTSLGEHSKDFIFNTDSLIPGRYTLHFKLYEDDEEGNVSYFDQCIGIKFYINHSDDSIHLKHWFKNWGYAVLPCLEQIPEDN